MRIIRHAGFTILELILTIVILGIVSVVVGRILIQGYGTFTTSQDIAETDWQGLLVVESINNDVHNIRSAGSISTTSATTFSFTDMSGSTVTYSLSGTALLRNGTTLATGVSSFTFGYLNSSGVTTATPSLVRYVTASFNVTKNNMTQGYSLLSGTRGMP